MRSSRSGTRVRDSLENGVIGRETSPDPLVAHAEGEVTSTVGFPHFKFLALQGGVGEEGVQRVRGIHEVIRGQEGVVHHVLPDVREINERLDTHGLALSSSANTGQ